MTTTRKPAAAKAVAKKTATRKPAAKTAVAAAAPVYNFTKPYKMLTGFDTPEFCDKVSAHLHAGYTLVGGAALTTVGGKAFVAQAVTKASNVKKPKASAKKKK